MGKKIILAFKFFIKCVLECIYPHKSSCLICKHEISNEDYICTRCSKQIFEIKREVEFLDNTLNVWCYGIYSYSLKDLILNFKFKNDFYSGEYLSNLLINLIKQNNFEFDIITYVPSSKSSLKKRGFNQCKIIAKNIGKELNCDVLQLILRTREGMRGLEQKRLTTENREKNIMNAFNLNSDYDIKNKNILLVDDVITTGYTLKYCKLELLKGGANSVKLLTIAKSTV